MTAGPAPPMGFHRVDGTASHHAGDVLPRTLIVGFGNPLLTDDAVGVWLAHDAERALAGWPGLIFCPHCRLAGLDLVDLFADVEQAVVFDALHTRGTQPGRWWSFTLAAIAGTRQCSHVHDVTLPAVLVLARKLGVTVPDDRAVHVFGVEVADDRTFGTGLTPALAAAYPRVSEEILHRVKRLLEHS